MKAINGSNLVALNNLQMLQHHQDSHNFKFQRPKIGCRRIMVASSYRDPLDFSFSMFSALPLPLNHFSLVSFSVSSVSFWFIEFFPKLVKIDSSKKQLLLEKEKGVFHSIMILEFECNFNDKSLYYQIYSQRTTENLNI